MNHRICNKSVKMSDPKLLTRDRYISHYPWLPPFWQIIFVLAISVEGQSVIISIKLFWILNTGFWGDCLTAISHSPWWPCFLMDQISFSCFCRGSSEDHFYEVWLKLAQLYRSCHLKKLLMMHNDDEHWLIRIAYFDHLMLMWTII